MPGRRPRFEAALIYVVMFLCISVGGYFIAGMDRRPFGAVSSAGMGACAVLGWWAGQRLMRVLSRRGR